MGGGGAVNWSKSTVCFFLLLPDDNPASSSMSLSLPCDSCDTRLLSKFTSAGGGERVVVVVRGANSTAKIFCLKERRIKAFF